jgi:POT family proton-dependent oligopeptide transporter
MKLKSPMPYSQKTSVFILSLIELFERFSYYGMRSIIVLFAINRLDIDDLDAISLYGSFSFFIFIIPLPAGIISDVFFKQKQGVLLGGILSLLGYSLLITEQMYSIGIGLILIGIGTGFVKPNLTVLVGRLFEKTDKNRGFGFMFYYFMINVGAFLSALLVGVLADKYGYRYGFIATAISTFIFLILFYLTKDRLQLIEKNVEERCIETNNLDDTVLDIELTQNKKFDPNPHILIFMLIFIITFFYQIFDVISNKIHSILAAIESSISESIFTQLNTYTFQIFNSSILLAITIIFYIVWYFRGLGSTISKISIAVILMGIASLIIGNFTPSTDENLNSILGLTVVIYTIAEVLISPFVLSYITRLSDVRFSSTMIGSFMFIIGMGSRMLSQYHGGSSSFSLLTTFATISIIIGLLLILFRKKILKMSGGLD